LGIFYMFLYLTNGDILGIIQGIYGFIKRFYGLGTGLV
jgi:hypothetical protein